MHVYFPFCFRFLTGIFRGNHSLADLQTILAGTSIGISFSIEEGYFRFFGNSNMDDLELALQLLTAFFIDSAFSEAVVDWFRGTVPSKQHFSCLFSLSPNTSPCN